MLIGHSRIDTGFNQYVYNNYSTPGRGVMFRPEYLVYLHKAANLNLNTLSLSRASNPPQILLQQVQYALNVTSPFATCMVYGVEQKGRDVASLAIQPEAAASIP